MNTLVTTIILMIVVNNAFASSINIECDFDYLRTDKFINFVSTCNTDANENCKISDPQEYFRKYKWYEFYKESSTFLSIRKLNM